MLQNAYFLAQIGADTAENEQHFAEIRARLPRARGAVRGGRGRPRGVPRRRRGGLPGEPVPRL